MSDRPIDYLLDFYPYEKMTDAMLYDKAATGDEEAEAELDRRSTLRVIGPNAMDTSPVETATEEVLLDRLAAGDQEAKAELERRYGLR